MQDHNFFLLDTFSDEPFKGNPTPIYLLEKPIQEEEMRSLTQELNCPVFVFLLPSSDNHSYQIRYFTTTGEIPACGHGTLGAAYVLFIIHQQATSIQLQTIENTNLLATKENDRIFIEYPKLEKKDVPVDNQMIESLGIQTSKSSFHCQALESLFIELGSTEEVKKVQPNYDKLIQSSDNIKEVVIMSESDDEDSDFTLRSFCPWIGINEDPVTGSIHAVLGHYWKKRLGKDVLTIHQASKRGGKIIVKPLKDSVKIGGDCKMILQGRITHEGST